MTWADGAPAPPRRRAGFASRLLLAEALVLLAGAVTTWLVATAVGPRIFHEHLAQAGLHRTTAETEHVQEAFDSALLISIGVALVIAVAAALVVSWYVSRRVQRSLGAVTAAAGEIAAGRYGNRVPDPRLGSEFAQLAESYNSLAARLEQTETTRRRMLADLAHEMRTPLATIDAHLEALEDGVRELDADTLGVLTASSRRLRRLADDMSAVSRAQEGSVRIDLARVPAAVVARGAVDAAHDRFAAAGVDLRLDADDDSGDVAVDRDRMGQVLGNLLDNALRHTPAGGVVTVSCHRRGDRVEYAVADTGEGIAPEHLGHVFDRFYRVDAARDRERGGSGIGLTIVEALVEAQGGQVRVASPGPGRGTTFTVSLPAADAGEPDERNRARRP